MTSPMSADDLIQIPPQTLQDFAFTGISLPHAPHSAVSGFSSTTWVLLRGLFFSFFLRFSSFYFLSFIKNSSSSKLKSRGILNLFSAKLGSVSDLLTSSPSTPSSPVFKRRSNFCIDADNSEPSSFKPQYHPSQQEFYRCRVKQSVRAVCILVVI